MRSNILFAPTILACAVYARPFHPFALVAREVPQEHSHEEFLTTVRASLDLNNPAGIVDPVFGLLGNAVAAEGLGTISDVECLQQATADQAFTNAKAAGDVNGQVAALIYRTLERNTGAVGLQSNHCTSITAVNPEIAALSQHQDPASDGAATTNKAIALALAAQIASVGGDPTDAIKSGTFPPGQIGDPTAAGHTCDTQNDPVGCIFTENLLVPDVTEDEIASALAGAGTTVASSSADAVSSDMATSVATAAAVAISDSGTAITNTMMTIVVTSTVTECGVDATTSVAVATAEVQTSSADSDSNLQTFTGDLGAAADAITFSGNDERPFLVNGDTFVNFAGAAQRTCDIQFNACADQANAGADFSVSDCQTQEDQCNAAQQSATVTSFSSSAAVAATSIEASSVESATATVVSSSVASSTSTTTTNSALDFGTCTDANPDIEFGPGFNGRTEDAFELVDQTNFPHGSADGIGVLTSFVCQQLQDKCKASASTLATCTSAQQAAAAASGQAAADAWNAAFAAA